MNLVQSIHADLLDETKSVASILLKVRTLAARLGSDIMGQWVSHESNGYPPDVEVPNYRKLPVRFVGNFSTPREICRNEIPPYIVQKLAGKHWVEHEFRQSICEVDYLIQQHQQHNVDIQLDAANLPLILGDKVYLGMNCTSVTASTSANGLFSLRHTVRDRLLTLILDLEGSLNVNVTLFDGPKPTEVSRTTVARVDHNITNIIGGNINILSPKSSQKVTLDVNRLDKSGFCNALIRAGFKEKNVQDLIKIISEEGLGESKSPFREQATEWIKHNLGQATQTLVTHFLTQHVTDWIR